VGTCILHFFRAPFSLSSYRSNVSSSFGENTVAGNDLSFGPWQGKSFCFHPQDNTSTAMYQLPGYDCHGHAPVNVTPAWRMNTSSPHRSVYPWTCLSGVLVVAEYKGPHLNALLPTVAETVTLSYESYVRDYIFADGADAIVGR
jgi:hypothetical protein